jgi:hypothetical protein
MLTTQGNGVSGSPITILFENGALFSAPYWGLNGAIFVNNHNYIVIDGGANGTIRNTLNGTAGGACTGGACTQQRPSQAIQANGNNNVVQNLIVSKIYVHTEGTNDNGGEDSAGIIFSGSNVKASHNTVDSVYTGIGIGTTNIYNIDFEYNIVTLCNHCLKIGINSGAITGVTMHDNDISDTYIWDQPDNGYHHNGIFTFADPAGTITGQYYNNYFHGIFSRDAAYGGSHTTALIFLEYDNPNSYIFNNVFALSSGDLFGTANGYITAGGSSATQYIFNNTFVDPNAKSQCIRGGNNSLNIQNNVFVGCWMAVVWEGTFPVFTSQNNIYYNINSGWVWKTDAFINYTQWKSDCGCDANSTNGINPNLDTNFKPQSGSLAISAGANLTFLGIAALNSDKAGAVRPSSGAWDIGAYQVSSGGGTATPLPGDLNLDHVINALDYSILNSHWLQNYPTADINTDGLVNTLDFAILKSNWGKTW